MSVLHLAVLLLTALCLTVALGAGQPTWPPGEWEASWLWPAGLDAGAHNAWFRNFLDLPQPVKRAWYQGSGDDGFSVYINGQEVLNSGFWWFSTRSVEITSYLKQGRNCLAAEARNAAPPGGFLGQFEFVMEDGTFAVVNTDETWQGASEVTPGWNLPEAAPGAFGPVELIGEPPVAPWGELPCAFYGEAMLAEVKHFEAVLAPEGDSLTVSLQLEDQLDSPLSLRLLIGAQPVKSLTVSGVEAASLEYDFPIAEGLAGELRLELSALRTAFQLPDGPVEGRLERNFTLAQSGAKAGLSQASLLPGKGTPLIEVEGEQLYPLMFTVATQLYAGYTDEMAQAGFRLYSFPLPWGKIEAGAREWSDLDGQLNVLLANAPEGWAIPRVATVVGAWWERVGLAAEPEEELIRYSTDVGWIDDEMGGTRYPSMASEVWQEAAEKDLRELVRHLKTSPQGSRVIGLHLANGINGEWHYWGMGYLPDISAPMQRAFSRYLRARYGTVEALREAWHDPAANFAEPALPTLDERLHSDEGAFLDPAKSQQLIDYYHCYHQVQADCLLRFCRAVKEESEGKLLTGAFWSYTSNCPWLQEGLQMPLGEVLATGLLDFVASPHTYIDRALTQPAHHRALHGSILQHGKLFFDEGDDRTWKANWPGLVFATNDWESNQLLWRQFSQALARRVGVWYFDMQSGWYSSPEMLSCMKRIEKASRLTAPIEHQSCAEIAVIADLDSLNYVANWSSGKDTVTYPLLNEQWSQLYRMGAPFDLYDLPEFLSEDFSSENYKLVILLNTFHLDVAQLDALKQRLDEFPVVLTNYAPGYVSEEGLSLAQLGQVAGMQVIKLAGSAVAEAQLSGAAPLAWGLPEVELTPAFAVEDASAETLGIYSEGGQVALARSQVGEGRRYYNAVPVLSAELLRWILAEEGLRLVGPSQDALSLDSRFVGLHAATAGEKVLDLGPGTEAVLDLDKRVVLPVEKGQLKLQLALGETFCGLYGTQAEIEAWRLQLLAD